MSIGIFNSEDQSLIKLASNSITADETIETLNDIKVSVATDKASVAADKATVSADKADIVSMKSEIANTKTTIDETAQTISENANSVQQEKIAIDETKTDIDKKYTEISNTASKLNTEYNNLTSNYYTKEATNSLISSTTKPKYSVVNELPTSDISTDIIYLKSTNTTSTDGIYEMYTYQDSNWVKIGTSNPDLADYYTKELADSTFATKTEINNTNSNVSQLKEDIANIVTKIESPNLYKGEYENGYLDYYGNFTEDNSYRTSKAQKFNSGSYVYKAGDGLSVSTKGVVYIVDNNGSYIGKITGTLLENNVYTLTLTSEQYLKFNMGTQDTYNEFMVAKGSSINDYPSEYVPYTEPKIKLADDVELGDKAKDGFVTTEIKEPINLYNGEYDNGYLTYYGEFTSDNSYECTKIQKYEAGTYLYYRATGLGVSSTSRVFFYDEDGTYLSASNGTMLSDDVYKITFSNTVYVRFNMGQLYKHDVFMVVKGKDLADFPTEYKRYFDKYTSIQEGIQANDSMLSKMADMSCLYKKSITFNGDSICYGAGHKGGYGKIIADKNMMVYQNIGISGATIAGNTYSGDGTARHWISRTISNMNENADYAIVEGGVNDASQNVPLGALSNGYNATLDDTTFYGAFESMLKQLTIRFSGKKIGYILVHQMVEGMMPNKPYYNAVIECLEKWCVPYINLAYEVPPFVKFTSDGDAELYAMRQLYTYEGDGCHPTVEGYKKYYVPKIEAWLKTL